MPWHRVVRSEHSFVIETNDGPVHNHRADTCGRGDQPVGAGRHIVDPLKRSRRDRPRIEDHEITGIALRNSASPGKAEAGGWACTQMVDRLFKRERAFVAYPAPEKVGREARVAQLARMGARVGETEHGERLGQERAYCGLVGVG